MSQDQALSLLLQQCSREKEASGVFFFSDNHKAVEQLPKSFPGKLITRRCDVFRRLQEKFTLVECQSFCDTEIPAGSIDYLLLRIGKEKAPVHHVINKAFSSLKIGGRLYLSGFRKEGIKTYVEKAATLFGIKAVQLTHISGARSALITKVNDKGQLLDDRRCAEKRLIKVKGLEFNSRPGIFGWDKVDAGSRFLIENLPPVEGLSVFDLGCGYGYLSIMASEKGAAEVTATDNLSDAVELCRENFKSFSISGDVILSDCGDQIERTFDVVLCNPPFHSAFEVDDDLTKKFAQSCLYHLNEGGSAYVVVNAFIPFEKVIPEEADKVSTLADNRKFKIIRIDR